MEFNFTKCKILHIGRTTSKRQYEMKGHNLGNGEISKEKNLGIQINHKISASGQVLEAKKRA